MGFSSGQRTLGMEENQPSEVKVYFGLKEIQYFNHFFKIITAYFLEWKHYFLKGKFY